jgi:hypothetical protein
MKDDGPHPQVPFGIVFQTIELQEVKIRIAKRDTRSSSRLPNGVDYVRYFF